MKLTTTILVTVALFSCSTAIPRAQDESTCRQFAQHFLWYDAITDTMLSPNWPQTQEDIENAAAMWDALVKESKVCQGKNSET